MKTLKKWMNWLGLDALLLGLLEKLALGLIKKLESWLTSARNFLDRVQRSRTEIIENSISA